MVSCGHLSTSNLQGVDLQVILPKYVSTFLLFFVSLISTLQLQHTVSCEYAEIVTPDLAPKHNIFLAYFGSGDPAILDISIEEVDHEEVLLRIDEGEDSILKISLSLEKEEEFAQTGFH